MVPFKIANLISDKEILEDANELANEVINSKKLYEDNEYKKILKIVEDNYNNNKEMLD